MTVDFKSRISFGVFFPYLFPAVIVIAKFLAIFTITEFFQEEYTGTSGFLIAKWSAGG